MALIPPQYINAVVSIEIDSKDSKGQPTKRSIATGFLLATPRGEKNKEGRNLYNISFVTNRHVYEDRKTGEKLEKVYWRFNTVGGSSHYFEVRLLMENGDKLWFQHKNDKVDIAVIPINPKVLESSNLEYYCFRDSDFLFAKDFKSNNITIGDSLFVLGFPMSISGKTRNFVIARQGILARVDEEVLNDCFYYIDASAYPGNSGGPVIHKPEVVCIRGTQSNSSAGLMGVISSGETYSDVAVSLQTQEPRIIFTEQTGLIRVVPIELVVEAISDFITSKKAEKAIPQKAEERASSV